MLIAKSTKNTKYYDKDIVNIDNDFVVYYDKVYDLFMVNDNVNVYNDKDNDNVNIYNDKDIVKVLKNEFNMPNDLIMTYNKVKDIKIKDNVIVFNDNDNDNDIVIVNNNKHINSIDKVLSLLVLINDIKNDNNSFILKDNVKDNDFDKVNDFVVIKMNKDIYYNVEYDLDKYIVFSYVVYNYDNDNVFVIVNKRNCQYFINNIDFNYMPLTLRQSYDFLFNQLDKVNNAFNQSKDKYFEIVNKTDKRSVKLKKHLIKVGNAKSKEIQRLKDKINDIDNNIKDFEFLRQYIVKTNCFYNDLNKLTNLCYKSFQSDYLAIELKNELKNIDKDNVNNNYLKKTNDIDFDNKIVNYFKELLHNNNTNDIEISIKNAFNELDNLYDIIDELKDNIIEIVNKKNELKEYLYFLMFTKNFTNFNDIVNDIEIIKNELKDLNKTNKDLFNVFNKFYIDYKFDNVNDIVYELDMSYDYLTIQSNVNNNDNDYDIYKVNIFDSKMTKHNSKVKVQQSEFLKMSYNDFYKNDFEINKDFYKTN